MHSASYSCNSSRSNATADWRRPQRPQRQKLLALGSLLAAVTLCDSWEAVGGCRYGELPGTMQEGHGGLTWQVFDSRCQIKSLLPAYLGIQHFGNNAPAPSLDLIKPVSMLLLGDSVDRSTVWDVNSSAYEAQTPGLQTLINEHWRAAIKMHNLEMVYQFTPGSHTIGPYHDDVLWNKTIVNALPRGLEMHRLLTGKEDPDILVFSDILWDIGRWLFLAEIAEPERMEHYGKPLLREQEYLPDALLEEFRIDTEVQMQRIENMVPRDTVLIYHNAAFPKLLNCSNGTQHARNGLGKRTHLVQMNAMARQMVAENPRWHLVDFGALSEASLEGGHLQDEHHPNSKFLLQVVNMYLNLYYEHGPKSVSRHGHYIGDVSKWDQEYENSMEEMQAEYAREAGAAESRYHIRKEAAKFGKKEPRELEQKQHRHGKFKMLFNVTLGRH